MRLTDLNKECDNKIVLTMISVAFNNILLRERRQMHNIITQSLQNVMDVYKVCFIWFKFDLPT